MAVHHNRLLLLLLIIFCSRLGADAVDIAIQQIGKPYVLGEESPERGFDCSGLTLYAYQGIFPLDRASLQQSVQGSPVSGEFRRGDLLFFETFGEKPNVVTHVGITRRRMHRATT